MVLEVSRFPKTGIKLKTFAIFCNSFGPGISSRRIDASSFSFSIIISGTVDMGSAVAGSVFNKECLVNCSISAKY